MTAPSAALALASRGILCFPCLATKAPACPRGFHAATTDASELHALWRAHPGPLVGVPTGSLSGFDALDINPRHGGDVWLSAHRDRIPATRAHATRSGGLHLLFRHADGVRNTAGRIAPGVDTRGEGGFIIWWPAAGCAVADRSPVAPWPTWLLLQQLPRPVPPPSSHPPPAIEDVSVERIIRAVLARLEAARPGERHVRLRAASYTLGGLAGAIGFSASEAERCLLAAVLRAGGDEVHRPNAVATIRSGLAKGAASPLDGGNRA